MTSRAPCPPGFTLVEMLIAIAVLSFLLVAAVPSFQEFRQRSSLRGAADQVVSFWGDARFEALRRNSLVKFSFQVDGADICLGAETTTSADAGDDPCDCFSAACDIANFPASDDEDDQGQWQGIRVPATATLGEDSGVAVIDPKRGSLWDTDAVGAIFLQGPDGNADYRLNVMIDRNGRAVICEPADAPSKIPAFTDLRCAEATP